MIHISRKLRLYISDVSDLSPEAILNLERMVNFIMAVFVEFWIRVKRWPNIADAASHYLFLITRLRDLDLVTQETVRPVFQRGGYCLHEESLLLSLLCSPDLHQRMFAVIQSARFNSYMTDHIPFHEFLNRPVCPNVVH